MLRSASRLGETQCNYSQPARLVHSAVAFAVPCHAESRREPSIRLCYISRKSKDFTFTMPIYRCHTSHDERLLYMVRAGWREQYRSWQSSACATFRCPDGTRPRTPTLPAPLTAAVQLAAPPTASQLLTAHTVGDSACAAQACGSSACGVFRTSSSCACTQDAWCLAWCRHNTRAAGSPGMGRSPRRKPRGALSAARIQGPTRGRPDRQPTHPDGHGRLRSKSPGRQKG